MGQDMPNINPLRSKFHSGDEPVIVSADIEDNEPKGNITS